MIRFSHSVVALSCCVVFAVTTLTCQAQGTDSPDSAIPATVFRDCAACPEMVVVPAGTFGFGSSPNEFGRPSNEGYVVDITFTRPFALGKFEVTFEQWDHCVRDQMCVAVSDEGWGRSTRPVVNVNWHEAVRYTQWLSQKSGKSYRLPTEPEWEYAARAGAPRARFFGIPPEQVCVYANAYDRTANQIHEFGWSYVPCADGYAETAPAGSFKANGFGLHDTLGNVWEWVQDCLNPKGRFSRVSREGDAYLEGKCSERAYRGGSWLSNPPYYLRTADRYKLSTVRENDLGFRVARSLD